MKREHIATGERRVNGATVPADVAADVAEEVAGTDTGADVEEHLVVRVSCRPCEGTGTSRASSHYQCVSCDARIPFLDYLAGTYGLPCGHDYDAGYLVRRDCEECGGKGYTQKAVAVSEFVRLVVESISREQQARTRYTDQRRGRQTPHERTAEEGAEQ